MSAERMLGVGLTPLETRREVVLHVARRAEDRWYSAGADMPTLCLPHGRDLETLDFMLESLRPR